MYSLQQDYAVTYEGHPISPLRPLRGVYVGGAFEVHDPDDPIDFPTKVGADSLIVHGRWTSMAHPARGQHGKTWVQVAEEQMEHVKRQRRLAERLTSIGIKRDPEPYIMHGPNRLSNAVELSLVLTYDEIDLLLRRGGV